MTVTQTETGNKASGSQLADSHFNDVDRSASCGSRHVASSSPPSHFITKHPNSPLNNSHARSEGKRVRPAPVDRNHARFIQPDADRVKPWAATYEQMSQEGGGHGWHGVADARIRLKTPRLKKKLDFDPEAGMFVAFGNARDATTQLAKLLLEAVAKTEALMEAIEKANPKLIG